MRNKAELVFGTLFLSGGGFVMWADITQIGSGLPTLCAIFITLCGIFLTLRYFGVVKDDKQSQPKGGKG